MADNSIGNFLFVSLHGEVVAPRQQIGRPQVRPGVDGVGLAKTGVRGQPFRLRSMVDQPDRDTAHDVFTQYQDSIGSDPVALVQSDYDYDGQEDFKVAVLGVRRVQLQDVLTAVGGLNQPSQAKLVCEWTLIAVANS